MTIHAAKPFADRYEDALANPTLVRNVTNFQRSWRPNRDNSLQEVEFEILRDHLKVAKTAVTDDLDHFLDQFTTAAKAAGSTIHFAADADAANRIVRQICEATGTKLVVKSKSMVSEEIELNHELEAHGITSVETDLGEWIIQKMGERPSHIVGPALHLGRQQVGKLLNEVLARPVSMTDIPEQVKAIRDDLRPQFFEAGVGINGANALIAESGTVMICTNEGNARLTASMPPVQVIIAGIEKLVPVWEDAIVQLRLLGRSGTGQRLTVYTSFMTGPTPGHQTHIVLVDNGRREMASRPEFVEALHCIRCGACANVCPPYREVSGHLFGHIYTGAIGLVVTPFLHELEDIAKPQSLCLSCNACETVCPVGIPLPRQIIDVRKMVVEKNGLPRKKKAVLAVYSRPGLLETASKVGNRLAQPASKNGFMRSKLLPGMSAQTEWRSMPAPASPPLHDQLPMGESRGPYPAVLPNGAEGKVVALFPGCMTDRLFPEQGIAIADSLLALGAKVVYPAGLNCCGLPANNMGDDATAKRMAQHTIDHLEHALIGADNLVSGSASCVATLAQDYSHLFRDQPNWLKRAEEIAAKVLDFTSFMDKVVDLPDGSLDNGESLIVTYHDSCQGLNALGLLREPRRLLVDVLGCELRELEENRVCCGFGGSFSFDYPGIAKRLLTSKLDKAEATGAPLMVTDNQGCIMHLRGGCDAQGRSLQIKHIAELVSERLASLRAEN